MDKFELSGEKQLLRKLESLEKKDAKKAVRKGTQAGAKIVQQQTKSEVPVDSGKLKKSIKVRAAKRKRGRIGAVVTIKMQGDEKANWFYGAFQEYGWTTVNGRRIPGKHFMKDAASKAGPTALSKATEIMRNEIDKT